MQNIALPIQLNATNAANAANGRSGANDGAQFGAMLSSEMAQRGAPPAASAPKPEAPRPQQNKPARADAPKPAEHAAGQAAQASADKSVKDAKNAKAGAADEKKADAADGADAADDAAAPGDPAAAMLALMANLHPTAADPAADTGAKAGANAAAFDALTGGGVRGKRGDAAQLAALQASVKGEAAPDGAGSVFAKTFAGLGTPTNPALAAAGAAVADQDPAAAAAQGAADAARLPAGLKGLEAGAQPQLADAELARIKLATDSARDAQAVAPAALQAAQLQPAVLEAAQAAAGAADQLHARVGTQAWENQVGQKVVWMVGSEEQTASLTLNPPDLGPLQVVLSVTNDGASVSFSSNHEEVRQALENALPRLREMMGEGGIALGNATVNAGMPDGRQAQDQQAPGGSRWGRGGGGGGRDGDADVKVGETTVRPARARALGDNGMVDTFA